MNGQRGKFEGQAYADLKQMLHMTNNWTMNHKVL